MFSLGKKKAKKGTIITLLFSYLCQNYFFWDGSRSPSRKQNRRSLDQVRSTARVLDRNEKGRHLYTTPFPCARIGQQKPTEARIEQQYNLVVWDQMNNSLQN